MGKNGAVVVTGASSGIGKTVAQFLSENGWKVVVTARRKEVLVELFGDNDNCQIIPWDLSDVDSVIEYTKEVKKAVGPISGLVHCAGVGIGHTVSMIKPPTLNKLFSINAFAAMLMVSGFSKRSMSEEDASFVLMSSIAAHTGTQGQSVYSATKGALEGFIKGSASELADKNIRINAIAPGIVMTDLVDSHYEKLGEDTIKNLNEGYPLRTGTPTDVAYFVEYLLSDKSSWITGQAFVMDGGFMIRKP